MQRSGEDFATGKFVDFSKPEEEVRQKYERILHNDLGYPKECMDIEVPIQMGASRKKCDIAIYDNEQKQKIIGIVETKAPKQPNGQHQLLSYMNVTPTCRWGVWTNGDDLRCAVKNSTRESNFGERFSVPRFGTQDTQIESYEDLVPASDLKYIFRVINSALYANSNLARTEQQGAEMVRLIFCKLVDEYEIRNKNKVPKFQVKNNEDPAKTRKRINELWNLTKNHSAGANIFSENEKIEIDDYSLHFIITKLQGYSLLKTKRDSVGDAFEIFSERQFAGSKGQFFTPRVVVDMVIGMLAPKKQTEKIIDPACGSGGFLTATFEHITEGIDDEMQKKQIAEHCLFGIDKDKDLAKICKAHMSIIGDGKSNIVRANSLESPQTEWDDTAKSKLLNNSELVSFDIVVTNPPFGSKIKIKKDNILCNYELGHKWKLNKNDNKWSKINETKETPPQILFIEFCLRLLKPGGRLGIVLPDGLLGNPRDGYIRQWIEEKAHILAVIDCPTATFMPHTGTKTSVIILRKRLSPEDSAKDNDIFMAIAEHCGHTMRGKDIYMLSNVLEKDSEEIKKEDFSTIKKNYIENKQGGHLGFCQKEVSNGILVPRYYDPRIVNEIQKLQNMDGVEMISIGDLQEKEILKVTSMPGSARSFEYSNYGSVRFIRTSNISNCELHERTNKMVDETIYLKYYRKQDLKSNDILFVKDGDDKIGETAILLDENDCHILVQTHFKKIRSLNIDPFLLLWLMNRPIVKKQISQRIFSQSTLSTIGDRILELRLPVPTDPIIKDDVAKKMRQIIYHRREALKEFCDLLG